MPVNTHLSGIVEQDLDSHGIVLKYCSKIASSVPMNNSGADYNPRKPQHILHHKLDT